MIKMIQPEQLTNFLNKNQAFDERTVDLVKEIITTVKRKKDKALFRYTELFDKVSLDTLRVTQEEIDESFNSLDDKLLNDLKIAKENLYKFHKMQTINDIKVDAGKDSYIGQITMPISDVGIYVPGGTAAYPSTVLMNAVPAKIAGVKRIVMVTPPMKNGQVKNSILAAAKIAGVNEIYKIGGAQSIAALAYGTETIQKVNKIVGPGNIYVALAKKEVYGQVGIDSIAGPSEILILADKTANPEFIAADLLSQAEHDKLASAILITTSKDLALSVQKEVSKQIKIRNRKEIIEESIENYSGIIVVDSKEEAINLSNNIAPEHLEILFKNPEQYINNITNAGAIFIGEYSPEPLGDYMAGPNHTLPTNQTAKFSSALSVYDFQKQTSLIKYSKQALKKSSNSVQRLALEEGLDAHAYSMKARVADET
ncbi:MAG: histidinol dehydrogenase [Candidatus Izimaplasma sp.]|nr:histidinol dehydrogenase [Candidatus Izimaplasma bacterium]